MTDTLKISNGTPKPLGLSVHAKTSNFALFSSHAEIVTLGLFSMDGTLFKEISMHRTGDIWHVSIENLPTGLDYAFRCRGPKEMCYNPNSWLCDPYAKIIHKNRARAALPKPFDWQKDTSPSVPLKDLIIYEMHVRGFTRDPSSKTSHPGTYLGFIEKIPYLKKLGVNAVELMPIFDSDEMHSNILHPKTKKRLPNYWGYNTFHFFAPKSWYAWQNPVDEFKTLVRELHKNGIEVILDVVYNHTGEGKDKSFAINFRGIDNNVYYMMEPHGHYLNFSGCDNTFNCNHPVVKDLIIDSLRYWVQEMHVDGFRFDLASIFTRDAKGHVLEHSPLIEAIVKDPIIGTTKLIAESWDAAGLYQVGTFPKWGPWSEWNDRYRDTVRCFLKGDKGYSGAFANVLTGSEMIYRGHSPLNSINFITAHDGFSLRDLVSYNQKHNLENGEANKDGNNHNNSWNCGAEGFTNDQTISHLRERQMRNFLLTLFMSQGIPMLVMGDAYGHTSLGNNNPYVQDNELSWFRWDELQKNQKIFQFISNLIHFRKTHTQLSRKHFWEEKEIEWHSATSNKIDWNDNSRFVACTFKTGENIYLAFNASNSPINVILPTGKWKLLVNTEEDWEFHNDGAVLPPSIELQSHASLLAIRNHSI